MSKDKNKYLEKEEIESLDKSLKTKRIRELELNDLYLNQKIESLEIKNKIEVLLKSIEMEKLNLSLVPGKYQVAIKSKKDEIDKVINDHKKLFESISEKYDIKNKNWGFDPRTGEIKEEVINIK